MFAPIYLHPEFRTGLNAAIEAAEKRRARGFQSLTPSAIQRDKRSTTQTTQAAQFRGKARFITRKDHVVVLLRLPVSPGTNSEWPLTFVTVPSSDKLHEWEANGSLTRRFGLEFLRGRAGRIDPVHIQLAS